MKTQKGFMNSKGLLLIAVLLVGSIFAIYKTQKTEIPASIETEQTSSLSDTSNWKEYNDVDISLKYPTNWYLSTSVGIGDHIAITSYDSYLLYGSDAPLNPEHIAISIYKYSDLLVGETVELWANRIGLFNQRSFILDGEKAIRGNIIYTGQEESGYYKKGESSGDYVLVIKNGKGHQITYSPYASKLVSTFDQILSTFKVAEPVTKIDTPKIDTSNWKTYTNVKYGFEFKYPIDFSNKDENFSKTSRTLVELSAPGPVSDDMKGPTISLAVMDQNVGPESIKYNPVKKQCWQTYDLSQLSNEELKMADDLNSQLNFEEKRINNYPTCSFHETRRGFSYDSYYMINQSTNIVAIITFFNFEGAKFDDILSTFKFIKPNSSVNLTLSAKSILNLSNDDLIAGGVRWSGYQLSVDKDRIIFGDLDEDGINEAVAPVAACAASCGMSVYVFKSYEGKIILSEITETSVGGAAQKINSLQIKNGRVDATVTDFGGTRTNSYYVELQNSQLVITPMVSPSP